MSFSLFIANLGEAKQQNAMVVFVETATATVLVGSLPELIVLAGAAIGVFVLVKMMLSGANWVIKRGSTEVRRVEEPISYTV